MSTLQEKKIEKYIEPIIADLGYDLVSLRVLGSQKLQTLQIMAEDPQTLTLDLEGCTKISRAISAILDVEDPFTGAYQLEVSSPGIDRPLSRSKDFEANIGFEATVEILTPAENGQKKYRGRITAIDAEKEILTLSTQDQGDVSIDLTDLNKAKLVLTDELIKASKEKRPKQNETETEIE
ncbi:MAG TPA: ribosome maturation factor RimP [Alphaproteobacteria bacterium]|nr:ribosome maturation factor RimP [Alphaproteobacteria bacterium]HOO50158.1 ribosome maturation factor RimP [Alphaproteobacteria bacterium]